MTLAALRYARVAAEEFFGHNPASHAEDLWLLLAVFYGHLRGQPLTARRIANLIGMPRTTVMRKLCALKRSGHVVRQGHVYRIADRLSRPPERAFDELTQVIVDAADALKKTGPEWTAMRSSSLDN